jgi:hypothetical protein
MGQRVSNSEFGIRNTECGIKGKKLKTHMKDRGQSAGLKVRRYYMFNVLFTLLLDMHKRFFIRNCFFIKPDIIATESRSQWLN